ncbi:hypothetical protein [Methylorubrum sp. SL192]|uniref:hypothetical protein n=1 Tax=Methylorubrum sp. SL192 TaxID=2995167 RepID=UPI00227706D6|nr:hypothetical protein [Methylorubrum sp. SL192]MCY1643482.1 hypothetical protein [Methylorubrum sp. SL192]
MTTSPECALERRLIADALASLRFQNPAATAAAISRTASDPSIAATLDIHVARRHDLARPAHGHRRSIDIDSHHHHRNSNEHCNASHGASSIMIDRLAGGKLENLPIRV